MAWSFVLLVGIALSCLLISGANVKLVRAYFNKSGSQSHSYSQKFSYSLVLPLVLGINFLGNVNEANSQICSTTPVTFTPAQSGPWQVPTGVTSITIQAWAGGGGGAGRTTNGAGAGGGGGAYSSSVLSVTPGQILSISVGVGGASNSDGGNSQILNQAGTITLIRAEGGLGGPANSITGVRGGFASNGIGDIRFNGGFGANATTGSNTPSNNRVGGGGGSSAGTNSNGVIGGSPNGGIAPAGGGNGGAGRDGDGDGLPGIIPGGGGGGGEWTAAPNKNGGAGANGQIIISYTPINLLTTTTSLAPSNTGGTATITITGNPAVLLDGTYQVTYSMSAPNFVGPSTATVVITNGTGSFATSTINNEGETSLTISQIKKNTDTCFIPVSANNVTSFGVKSNTYASNGTFYVPAGVSQITMKVWAGGGGGGNGANGAGGAGGGYSQVTIPVTPGEPIGLFVGAGGTAQTNGGDSWATRDSSPPNALSTSLVYAKGGQGASGAAPGSYNTGLPILTRPGYGSTTAGGNGIPGNGGNGGAGGGFGGGVGGTGGTGGTGGNLGTIRGGGGGGASGAATFGGSGGAGQIQIFYPLPPKSTCFTVINDGAITGTTIIEFTSNCTWTAPEGLTSYEVLVVGGGAAGGRTDGNNQAGGGGGGAEVSAITTFNIPFGTSPPATTIIIGAGGTGSSTLPADRNGQPSSFSNGTTTITVQGGGAGGLGATGSLNGLNAASGGGGGAIANNTQGTAGTRAGNGFSENGANQYGGGGAGAGGNGLNAISGAGGAGGGGLSTSFTGSPRFFAAGGGGGSRNGSAGAGGNGIGGVGGSNAVGGNALANSGSGGGGAGGNNLSGGNGGSGIVLLRYDNFRILPVEFLYFEAKYNTSLRSGELTWGTAKEWESSHFEIERSVNGVSDWNKISEMEGQGYSEIPTEYSFSDSKLPASGGIVYYRLKQVDFNGKFSYSNTKSIKVEALKGRGAWIAYPNPSSKKNIVTLDLINRSVYADEPILIRISDIKGVSETFTVNQIESVSEVVNAYLDRSISGMYVLQLIWGDKSQQIKLLRN